MKITMVMPYGDEGDERRSYARFAEEVGQRLGTPIVQVYQDLRHAPATGFVITDSHTFGVSGSDLDPNLWRRLVVLDANKSELRELLQRYRPALAVEKMELWNWERSGYAGVMGLKELGPSIGAEVWSIYPYDPYRPLTRKEPGGVPGLVADYLKAYQELLHLPE